MFLPDFTPVVSFTVESCLGAVTLSWSCSKRGSSKRTLTRCAPGHNAAVMIFIHPMIGARHACICLTPSCLHHVHPRTDAALYSRFANTGVGCHEDGLSDWYMRAFTAANESRWLAGQKLISVAASCPVQSRCWQHQRWCQHLLGTLAPEHHSWPGKLRCGSQRGTGSRSAGCTAGA